jgi:hypothetical protein
MRVTRQEVYNAIDSEREYQNSRWNENTTTSLNKHSLEEWFMYMEDYLNEAKHVLSRTARQEADPIALNIMRKVVTLGVAAMEEHGAPKR